MEQQQFLGVFLSLSHMGRNCSEFISFGSKHIGQDHNNITFFETLYLENSGTQFEQSVSASLYKLYLHIIVKNAE
ncbi:hypothetical protein A3767_25510 [Oleiphilus sp. HI0133]|nr:hypothetical protein A3767_25510 [Oleiphilus sp. HI0133]